MLSQKKVAILQSNYIPWKGYFDLINMVDEFIFYDEVQFTKNDWRNRNKIKTVVGVQWLTIPVMHVSLSQKIKDTKIANSNWSRKHWNAILMNYSKARHFSDYYDIFQKLYSGIQTEYLSEINYLFIKKICELLGITTILSWSSDWQISGGKTERLINLCKQVKASSYITGPSAKSYLDYALFEQEGISIKYIDYSNYPEYFQLYSPFVHEVSIIDLLFNEGPKAISYMKSFNAALKS